MRIRLPNPLPSAGTEANQGALAKEACDKLHLTLDAGRYVKCIWREQCTAEAVVEGAPPCTEATVNTPRLSQSAT